MGVESVDTITLPKKLVSGIRAALMDAQYLTVVDDLDSALAATTSSPAIGTASIGDDPVFRELLGWVVKDVGEPQKSFHMRNLIARINARLSATPATQPSATGQGMLRQVEELFSDYWDIAYGEGQAGCGNGEAANAVLSKLRALFAPATQSAAITDAKINEITQFNLGKWPSFEAQSWACKVVHAVLTATQAADTDAGDELRKEVATMYQLLDDGEWAEHIARTPHGQCLETAITKLIGKARAADTDARDAALTKWTNAEQARRDAIAAYNAVVKEAEREIWPGRDVNPEFQVMATAQNSEFRARCDLFDAAMSASVSEADAQKGDAA